MRKRFVLLNMIVMMLYAAGCSDTSDPSTYTEPAPEKASLMEMHGPEEVHNHREDDKKITWTLPEGLNDSGPSGMALARITSSEYPKISITITRLEGEGGGLNPNIQRWASQLGVSPLSDSELTSVQSNLKHNEGKGTFIDFDVLPSVKEISMKVCVSEYSGFTLFLKMQGPKEDVSSLSPRFISLAESISYK
jgi:hypothetical protein